MNVFLVECELLLDLVKIDPLIPDLGISVKHSKVLSGRCDHCDVCVILSILSIGNELLSKIRPKTQKDSVKSKSLLNLKIRYKPSEIFFA